MGRPREYSDERIIAALKKYKGLVYVAAESLGCDPDTIYERMKVSPAVAAAKKNARGLFVDRAEEKLSDAVEAGESWAIGMVLKCLGRDRGFYEKQEVESTNRVTLEIVEEVTDGGVNEDGGP